jgi:hypothetical protein
MIGTQMNADFQDSIRPKMFFGDICEILGPFQKKDFYNFLTRHSRYQKGICGSPAFGGMAGRKMGNPAKAGGLPLRFGC